MAISCPIKTTNEWKNLTNEVTETNAMLLYEMHNGNIVSPKVGRNEVYEEYGAIYGSVELQESLPRPNSFFEYSNFLKTKGINVIIGDTVSDFEETTGYKGYNPLVGKKYGVQVAESDVYRYSQKVYNDIGYAIESAKAQSKKVLVYRTTMDGDIVVLLDKNLKTERVDTKENIELFEEYSKYLPTEISGKVEQQLTKDTKKTLELNEKKEGQHSMNTYAVLSSFVELAEKLGVEYEVVSVDKAIEITENATDKFTKETKEPGFFYKGKIYLIEGRVNEHTALHELSHFVVRAIRLQNKKLFDEMFSDAIQSKEGRDILEQAQKRSEASPDVDELKEEVLATLLKIRPKNEQNILKRVVDKLWYWIKQAIRFMFGGNKLTKVSDLNANTTLYQLAEMIQEGGIERISTRGMELSDIVLYDGSTVNVSKVSFSPEEVKMMSNIFKETGKVLKSNMNKLSETDAKKYLEDCGLIKELQELIYRKFPSHKDLVASTYRVLNEQVDDAVERMDSFVNVCNAFASAIITMNDLLDVKKMKLINEEDVNASEICERFITIWQNFFKGFSDNEGKIIFENENVNRILDERMHNINRLVDSCKAKINTIKTKCTVDTLGDEVDLVSKFIDTETRYSELLDTDKNNSLNPTLRVRMEIEYYGMTKPEYDDFMSLYRRWKENHNSLSNSEMKQFLEYCSMYSKGVKVDRIKIELLLEGYMDDMGMLTAWMDEYINSQDLIVAPFQKFLKDHYSNALSKTNRFSNSMIDEIKPLMYMAGFNEGDETGLRDAIAMQDHVYYNDTIGYEKEKNDYIEELKKEGITQTGDPIEFHKRMQEFRKKHNSTKRDVIVWTLKNEYRNYRYEYDKAYEKVELAMEEYEFSNTQEAFDDFVDKLAKFNSLKRVFFCNEYVDEFYEPDDYMNDDIGIVALHQRNEILARINDATRGDDNGFEHEENKEYVKKLWREYRQLMSDYNEDGTKKTGINLQIAEKLRTYKDMKSKFYNRFPDINAFELEYQRVQKYFEEIYHGDTNAIETALHEWVNGNTIEKGSEEYYRIIEENNAKLVAIREKNGDKDLAKEWEELTKLVSPYREPDGSIDYSSMSSELMDKVNALMAKIYDFGELTDAEQEEYEILKQGHDDHILTMEEENRLNVLKNKMNSGRKISKEEQDIYDEINSVREKVPSHDYLVELTNIIFASHQNLAEILRSNGIAVENVITEKQAIELLGKHSLVQMCKTYSKAFKEWFERCHTEKEYGHEVYYNRKYIYNRYKIREGYLDTYQITDAHGKVVEVNMPNNAYTRMEVKPEYIRKQKVGVTKDNTGRWLPKSKEEMDLISDEVFIRNGFEPTDRYKFINLEYYEMKKNGGNTYKLLEAIKRKHLECQKNADNASKLWYDVPRYTMDNYDVFRSNTSASWFGRFKERFATKTSAIASERMSYDKAMNIVRIDMIDEIAMPDAPVQGLFNIDYNYVSPNILTNIIRYAGSLNINQERQKTWGIAKTIQEKVNDAAKKTTGKKKGLSSMRAMIFNNLVNTEYFGVYMAGNTNSTAARTFDMAMSELAKLASFSFFAFDFYSSTKNYTGAKFQQLVEGVGCQHYTPGDLAKGDVLAVKAMGLTMQFYKAREHKPLLLQLGDAFDFIQGRTMQRMGREMSNSHLRGVSDFDFPTSFRKWGEFQATYQLGYSILCANKVKNINDGKLYDMTEIYEVNALGEMVLKEGFDKRYSSERIRYIVDFDDTEESILKKNNVTDTDPEVRDRIFRNIDIEELKTRHVEIIAERDYKLERLEQYLNNGRFTKEQYDEKVQEVNDYADKKIESLCSIVIENTEFTRVKNMIHGLFNLSNGAYAKEDANYLSRTLIGKPLMCLKKYFFPMFANKYVPRSISIVKVDGHRKLIFRPRYSFSTQTVRDPVYLSAVKSLCDRVRYDHGIMSKSDKANLAKMGFEFVMVGIVSKMIISALFGFDDDDDDMTPEELRLYRNEKFKEMSSAATWWDIPDDFNFGGWLRQRAIVNMMLWRQENSQFSTDVINQLPNVLSPKLISFDPTVDNYSRIINDLIDLGYSTLGGDPERNLRYTRDVGPYPWQKEESFKMYSNLFRCFGLNGNNLENFKRYEQMTKTNNFGMRR